MSFFAAILLVAGLIWFVHRKGKYGNLKWNKIAFLTSNPRVNEAELKGFVGYGFFYFLTK